jgi:hypothetical protein
VPGRFEDGTLDFAIEPGESQVWFTCFEPCSRARD